MFDWVNFNAAETTVVCDSIVWNPWRRSDDRLIIIHVCNVLICRESLELRRGKGQNKFFYVDEGDLTGVVILVKEALLQLGGNTANITWHQLTNIT